MSTPNVIKILPFYCDIGMMLKILCIEFIELNDKISMEFCSQLLLCICLFTENVREQNYKLTLKKG